MSITILNPAITQQIGRSAVAPSWLRNLPFIGNNSGNPSQAMGFANPYTETQNNAQIVQQQGALHNASINIMKKLNKSMAPGPNTQISLQDDQINSISRQRDEILKIDQQQKLAKQEHKPSRDGTYKEFQNKIDQQMQQPKSKSDEILDIKKKLQRNQMEESKGDNDPIYQKVLDERKQLEDKLKQLQNKPQQSQDILNKLESQDLPFEDRMQLMTDLRKLRDNASTQQEKDQINERLKQIRAKPKQSKPEEAKLQKKIRDLKNETSDLPQNSIQQQQFQEILNMRDMMADADIDQIRINGLMDDIMKHGLLDPNAYSPNDPRNYLRDINNPKNPNYKGNKGGPNGPNGNGNDPDGNPDNNDDEVKDQLKQAAINRITNIINDPKKDAQEKSDAIHQHIQNLDHNEINIIYNVYTKEKKEDVKNNIHGHVDADAILTSLIE